ncbi:MAG: hypothetical protein IKZ09_00940 [Clostridia bacterium]|nr:hypothetical protein [Clostridia bacterium]
MNALWTSPDITAHRRRRALKMWIPTVLWCILVAVFEVAAFYDYTYENLGVVTAIGLWILLSLIVPIRLGLVKYLFDASWEGTVVRMEDQKRWVPNYGRGRWKYELEMYCQKPNGGMINKTFTSISGKIMIHKNTIDPQLYHVGDRVVYLRGTYVPFIVHREGEVPPAVCVLCGKDNPAGTKTCLSCHADILREQVSN